MPVVVAIDDLVPVTLNEQVVIASLFISSHPKLSFSVLQTGNNNNNNNLESTLNDRQLSTRVSKQ